MNKSVLTKKLKELEVIRIEIKELYSRQDTILDSLGEGDYLLDRVESEKNLKFYIKDNAKILAEGGSFPAIKMVSKYSLTAREVKK